MGCKSRTGSSPVSGTKWDGSRSACTPSLPSYRGVEQMVARRAHNPEVVRFKSHPRNQTTPPRRVSFCLVAERSLIFTTSGEVVGSEVQNDSISFCTSETAQSKEYGAPRHRGDAGRLCDGGGPFKSCTVDRPSITLIEPFACVLRSSNPIKANCPL